MDMKKILQAFDGAATKKAEGANDMKRFLSVVVEGAKVDRMVQHVKASEKELGKSDKDAENIAWATANKRGMLDNKNKKTEAIVTGFEEGSLGGDANGFLLAADDINDLVMSNVDKIKINANEEKLKDMMAKFNAFMSAYHSVGKEILQPDMFGEDAEIDEAGYRNRDAYQRDYDSSRTGFGKQSRAYQADGGANDEYNTPEYDPAFEKNKQESTMYNITVDGKPVNPKPILGRSNALAWAKEQVKVAGLDVSNAKLSPVKYGEGVDEASFDYTMKDLGNDYAGFPSNHSMKHKFLARIKPEKQQLYKDKINNTHEWDDILALFNVAKQRGDIIGEGASKAMANTAKRLTDPDDGKTTKLRAAGDKRREEHLKSRDIAKKNESLSFKDYVALTEASKQIKGE